MQIIDMRSERRHPIDRFGSTGARHVPGVRADGGGVLGLIELAAGGHLGRHPAVVPQLFLVVSGHGWVAGADGSRVAVESGQAALWAAGEEHESGSETGMTAVVLEARAIEMAFEKSR